MARTAKLVRWFNKTDITMYYRGKKIFRGDVRQCEAFERSFNEYANDPEAAERLLQELVAAHDATAQVAAVEDDAPVAQPANMNLTKKSIDLFVAYAEDACNWSGTPLVGGNVGGSKEDRGNLTQLKKAGLIETDYDREEDCTWILFTDMGVEYASALGITVNRH